MIYTEENTNCFWWDSDYDFHYLIEIGYWSLQLSFLATLAGFTESKSPAAQHRNWERLNLHGTKSFPWWRTRILKPKVKITNQWFLRWLLCTFCYHEDCNFRNDHIIFTYTIKKLFQWLIPYWWHCILIPDICDNFDWFIF